MRLDAVFFLSFPSSAPTNDKCAYFPSKMHSVAAVIVMRLRSPHRNVLRRKIYPATVKSAVM